MNTIIAISTPIGTGAINIIRMSGSSALLITKKIFNPYNKKELIPNYMTLGEIKINNIKDKILCVYFKNPNSYTGEDLIEFHCHGSYKLSDIIVKECIKLGAIPATKGEFTKRAFLNGKILLSEAEGIIDMINSESESELNAASKIMDGTFSKIIKKIQKSILDSTVEFETSLDYPDEYDGIIENRIKTIKKDIKTIKKILDNSKFSKNIKNGINIALIGNPNAGKSSLLNIIIKENKAIVTNIPGTTRDVVEGSVEYKGLKFNFFDTAGIRESLDEIEKLGIEKSKKTINFSDIILFIKDINEDLNDFSLLKNIPEKKIIKILNKIDIKEINNNNYDIKISAKNDFNIDKLLEMIYKKVINTTIDTSGIILTSERQIYALKNSLNSLNSFIDNYNSQNIDCLVLDLRDAYYYLGEITGNTATEDIIESIFENFCVGK